MSRTTGTFARAPLRSRSTIVSHSTPYNDASSNHFNSASTIGDISCNNFVSTPTASSLIDLSTVQKSWFDKARWQIFRYVYISVIRVIDFDVWLLSRPYRTRCKILLLLFFPCLIYLMFSLFPYISAIGSSMSNIFSSVTVAIISSLHGSGSSSILKNESQVEGSELPSVLSTFTGLASYLPSLFYFKATPPKPEEELKLENIESLVSQVLQREQRLKNIAKDNNVQNTQNTDSHLKEELSNLHSQIQFISKSLEQLKAQVQNNDKSKETLNRISSQLQLSEEKQRKCCNDIADLATVKDDQLLAMLKTVTQGDSRSAFFREWLLSHLTPAPQQFKDGNADVDVHLMQEIVKDAIKLYDADKNGKVDYALETGGGSVVGTRCSENYVERNGIMSILGWSLWTRQNTPRTAIQPGILPGECWAFKGSHGFLVVQLSYSIRPTGFTLEHVDAAISPTGSIDSAPKQFSVWGLAFETDSIGLLLGEYTYDANGEPMQYFPIQNTAGDTYSFVELKIHSNHGNLDYTCLYRFRVHGKRVI